jgi:hypothetical protein
MRNICVSVAADALLVPVAAPAADTTTRSDHSRRSDLQAGADGAAGGVLTLGTSSSLVMAHAAPR